MHSTQKLRNSATKKKLVLTKTLACLFLAVILSTDLLCVRTETLSCVVIDIVSARKQPDRIKVININSSEVSLLDVTEETIKQIQIGERIQVLNSLILHRTVSIKRQYYTNSQRILPFNVLIFVFNILAIVGYIDGLINIFLQRYRSSKRLARY